MTSFVRPGVQKHLTLGQISEQQQQLLLSYVSAGGAAAVAAAALVTAAVAAVGFKRQLALVFLCPWQTVDRNNGAVKILFVRYSAK